ncbi:hypothetical protein [Pseudoneobacillus sp. C159]
MEFFSTLAFYEMEFEQNHFQHLQFIRLDMICEVIYITMKNVMTGEWLTFEHTGIRWIRKMELSFDIIPQPILGIAQ